MRRRRPVRTHVRPKAHDHDCARRRESHDDPPPDLQWTHARDQRPEERQETKLDAVDGRPDERRARQVVDAALHQVGGRAGRGHDVARVEAHLEDHVVTIDLQHPRRAGEEQHRGDEEGVVEREAAEGAVA